MINFATKLFTSLKANVDHPLRTGSKLGAIWKFGIAQVASRLAPGDVCIPFPNGTVLVVPPRMKGAAHFISPGLCEFEQMAFTAHFLRPGDLFIDAGANLGAYSLLASGVAGATCIAVEPCLPTFRSLQQTVKWNNLEPLLTPINMALGSKPGTLQLTQSLGTENFISTSTSSTDHVEVPVTTLDQLVGHRIPAFLKLDVEGFESEVIAGGGKTVDALQAAIVERTGNASRYGFDEDELHASLRAKGFRPYTYEPFKRRLQTLPTNALGNIIYLRDEAAAAKRLKEARAFTFRGFHI